MDDLADFPARVWTHPSVEVRRSPISGDGLFAAKPIQAGVVVLRLGGRLVSTTELHRLFTDSGEDAYIDTFAIGDGAHLVLPPNSVAHFLNHGCDPTIRPISVYEVATCRSVNLGEELTIDYGLISDDETFRMDCTCGAATCRRVITGENWRRPDLQKRDASD